MQLNEVKDRLFDILNDTDNLPITDIMVDDNKDQIRIYLEDGTIIRLTCESLGIWQLYDFRKKK